MERDTILVPTDFTPVADCAMDHAVEIAKLFTHKICMLHVINKKASAHERDKAEKQLQRIAFSHQQRSGIQVSSRVEEGSIFDEISNTATHINAEFIIMGIHGKKGVQHILGSYAYKVISSSLIPVMVVKKKHHHVGYDKIVIPVDFSVDSSQKINKAIRFAKYFDSTIHIIGVLGSSSKVSKLNKEVLLKKVHDYIIAAGVKSTTEVLIRPGSELHEEVLDYAEKVDADLIMIVAEKSGPITEFLGRNDTEQIIDKAEIPVLTIIPNEEYDDDDDNTLLSSFFDPLGLIDKP
jgi:nucleotide-binding universal stress UspA family protein